MATTKNSRGTYFKVQYWDAVSLAWRDVQRSYPTPEMARGYSSGREGEWRVMEVAPDGRRPLAPGR